MIWTWLARNPLSTVLLVAVLTLSALAGWLALSRAAVRVDLANAQAQFAAYQRDQAAAVGEIAQNTMAEIARQRSVTHELDTQLGASIHEIDRLTAAQRAAARDAARLRSAGATTTGASAGAVSAGAATASERDSADGTGLQAPAAGARSDGVLAVPVDLEAAWVELARCRVQAAQLATCHRWAESMQTP